MFRLRCLACSFCRRKESEVEKLVAGRGRIGRVYICDRCVAIARQLMASDGAAPPGPNSTGAR
jgi:ATP-dependent protease Clp ATPase subunit